MKNFIVETGPYIESLNKTKRIMRNVLIALLPIILFTIYKNGYIPYTHHKTSLIGMFYPLIFILIPTITTYIVECLYNLIINKNKKAFKDGLINSYSFFPGLFLGLILSINTPILIVIIASIFASIVGKMVWGGFGKNRFNPALVGGLFILLLSFFAIVNTGGYANAYEKDILIDTVSGATPLSNLSTVSGIGTYETNVAPYGSLWNFFLGAKPGAVGETSALLCLLALVYLIYTKTIKWKIPVIYIGTVFIITYAIGSINNLGIWYPLFQIFSGGLMFGAVFMATDPVTSPTTPIGQIIYALFLGILTVFVRYLLPFPEGVLLSILIMNLLVRILDRIGARARFSFTHTLIPFVIAWIIMIGLIIGIGLTHKNPPEHVDTNFNIISRNFTNKKATYIVTQRGYSSTLKAKIIIDNGTVTSYTILEENDSLYSEVEDANYTDTLIENQNNLTTVDTVSGATITSNALKKMLSNTIKDYEKGDTTNIGDNTDNEPIPDPTKKAEFNVIDVVTSSGKTIYTIEQKGFMGKIKLKVTFKNDKITTIQVMEHNEEEYVDKVINEGYLDDLIDNQNNIDSVDTVSGATRTSTSLKNAILNTISAYEGSKTE